MNDYPIKNTERVFSDKFSDYTTEDFERDARRITDVMLPVGDKFDLIDRILTAYRALQDDLKAEKRWHDEDVAIYKAENERLRSEGEWAMTVDLLRAENERLREENIDAVNGGQIDCPQCGSISIGFSAAKLRAENELLQKSRRKLARWLPFSKSLINKIRRPDMPEHLIHNNMTPEDWIQAAEEVIEYEK